MNNQYLEGYWEKKKHLEENNDFPDSFQALIDDAALKYGGKKAINFFDQGRELSFLELRNQVYCLADGLHTSGVKKGSHVAVMLSNCIEFPVTWLALGVLGAVMVPVNVRYTCSELDYQFNDADVEFVVIEEQYLSAFDGMKNRSESISNDHVVVLSDNHNTIHKNWYNLQNSGASNYRPDWAVSSTDLMNIQYTSGSTGFPKGCMQSQNYWLVMGCTAASLSDSIQSILSDHPFFYMDPQWLLVMGLYSGATVHYAERLSIKKFVQRVKDYDIEFSLFPRPMVGEHGVPEDSQTALKKLFAVAAGAEGVRNVERRFQCLVRDGYGMTEIGLGLCLPDSVDDPAAYGSCGVPTPFRECKIVREDGSECGIGEKGELLVRGYGVFSGYYNNEAANRIDFEGEWFKTGDLFLKDDCGYYRIVGRIKDMVRRSSETISALEVEQALTMVEGVQQVAVLPVADSYRGEEVKAYVLLETGVLAETVTPQKIIKHCSDHLAEFKIPRYIEYVTEFPYTPTHKVAKQRLKLAKDDLRENSWDRELDDWL